MSERVFRFRADELGVVRIVCTACGVVTEMTLERMAGQNGHRCQGCNAAMGSQSAFELARAVEFLKKYKDFKIELVLPNPTP